ncbi:glycosyltransferase family 2 protein [Alicyclobacillus dauci]|uniref:Glycosyltransferase family 2 protein n=1 Tax=Alicyclobacillus dauci TaxID=1475485 RepID=A0ABY6Z7Q9_9BACL|nr:glycosyltransferase family 2 protein [Alicyclobacillus dauci]WAH38829.1 glycosyltransferase family 2 protein [Alicyclobacillus dauci]
MRIAVLLPCYNEELTIEKVIRDFRRELPEATIYVYDNNSRDKTAEIARNAGAVVRRESRQGKGNVVRSMFRDIDADIYVMADGDDTYPAEFVHDLMKPVIDEEADMTIGDRHSDGSYESENKRPFHNFGNHFVKGLINRLFRSDLRDIMTGYRVFNRRFAKTMPVKSEGFEIETEMTLHALDKRFRILEIPIQYRDRPPGSESKLNTVKDGIRVLKTVFWIFKDYKPLSFFSFIALIFFVLGLLVGVPVVTEFFQTGLIAKMPSAILAVGLMVLATNSLTCGFILDTIVRNHRDQYELRQNEYRE